MYDCAIIGGGPAALTAAIYLSRFERKTVLLYETLGGQTAISGTIENYPGFKTIGGYELITKIKEQVDDFGVEQRPGYKVDKISKSKAGYRVSMSKNSIEAKTVLVATGRRHRTLGFENEDKLIGKGISYCATCDGAFSRDKDVIVIGGGYAATEAALILEKIAKSVTIICLENSLTGEKTTISKVEKNPRIKIIYDSRVIEFLLENGMFSGLRIMNVNTNKEGEINASMAFVEIGQVPNSDSFDKIKKNEAGEIIIDENNMTSISGVFAAGDVTSVKAKQTIVACGEAAKAAVSINGFIEKQT